MSSLTSSLLPVDGDQTMANSTPTSINVDSIKSSPYLVERKRTLSSFQYVPPPPVPPANNGQESLNVPLRLVPSSTISNLNILYNPKKARKLLYFHSGACILFILLGILIFLVGRYSSLNYTLQLMIIKNNNGNNQTTNNSPLFLQIFWSLYLFLWSLYILVTMYVSFIRRYLFPFKARPLFLLILSNCAGWAWMLWCLYRTIFNANFSCIYSKLVLDIFLPMLTFPYIFRAFQLSGLFSNFIVLSHRKLTILFFISLIPFIFIFIFTLVEPSYRDLDNFACENYLGVGNTNNNNNDSAFTSQSNRSNIMLATCDAIQLLLFALSLFFTRKVWDEFQMKTELSIAFAIQFIFFIVNLINGLTDDGDIEDKASRIVIPLVMVRSVLLFFISFSFPLYQSYAMINNNNRNNLNNRYSNSLNANKQSAASSIGHENNSININYIQSLLFTSPSFVNTNDTVSAHSHSNNPTPTHNPNGQPGSPPAPINVQNSLLGIINNVDTFNYFKDYMCSETSIYSSLWEFYISCVLYSDSDKLKDRVNIGRYILNEFFNEGTFNGSNEFSQWFIQLAKLVFKDSALQHESGLISHIVSPSENEYSLMPTVDENRLDAETQAECEREINNLMLLFYQEDHSIDEMELNQLLYLRWQEAAFELMEARCWTGFTHSIQYQQLINLVKKDWKIKQRLKQASII